MKKFLIMITISLVVLCMVKGSQGTENTTEQDAVSQLNQVVDAQLLDRVQMLALGMELSEAIGE